MKNPHRKIKLLIAVILLATAAFVTGRIYLFWRIEKSIDVGLESLRSEGILVKYQSLEVNSWRASITIKALEMRSFSPDSVCASTTHVPEFRVEGISLFPLIFRKLFVKSVWVDHPTFHDADNFKTNHRKGSRKNFLGDIEVEQLLIESGTWETTDSLTCNRKLYVNLDFVVKDLTIHSLGNDAMTFSVAEAKAGKIIVDLPTHFYKMAVKQVAYTRAGKMLMLDSLHLTPTLNRREFARSAGRQIDQFTLFMASMKAEGFEVDPGSIPSMAARQIDLAFKLEVFRDKRIARARRTPTVLPVKFLRGLPYRLQIDTLLIHPSFISYEEFPENGIRTGRIFFNNLEASIHPISNDSLLDTQINVTSRFMDAGDLQAAFTFPANEKDHYTARGSLTQFSMPAFNGMLRSRGKVKIKSGTMNRMKFDFRYNDNRSEGGLEVNYSDLMVLSLHQDKQHSTNIFASLLMSVFVKKDMGIGDTRDDRTGRISTARDTQRGILNYWWRSVLSGLKDVFGLDQEEKSRK